MRNKFHFYFRANVYLVPILLVVHLFSPWSFNFHLYSPSSLKILIWKYVFLLYQKVKKLHQNAHSLSFNIFTSDHRVVVYTLLITYLWTLADYSYHLIEVVAFIFRNVQRKVYIQRSKHCCISNRRCSTLMIFIFL